MPWFGPISRDDLIRNLRKVGYDGPYSGGKHQYMVKGQLKLVVPNPHKGEVSQALLHRILQQAGISRDEWEKL